MPRDHFGGGIRLRRRLTAILLTVVAVSALTAASRDSGGRLTLTASNGGSIAAWAQTQVGYTCAHYGWCGNPWCAKFASDAWDKGGGAMPSYWSVSAIHTWAVSHGQWRGGWGAYHHPGDLILYQDAWGNWAHVGVIVSGAGNGGAVTTVEGNYSSRVSRVGPFAAGGPGGWEPGFHVAGYVATIS